MMSPCRLPRMLTLALFATALLTATASAQVAPSPTERAAYTGLHRAAADGDTAAIARLLAAGADVAVRDGRGRTPLHVATFAGEHAVMRTLVVAGADPNALDHDRYDSVTIAAVADDLPTLELALRLGGDPRNVTSVYAGNALIAAAHLGHAAVVERLLRAGAPLDHVNSLGWTAVIEAIVLGDGGPGHVATLAHLLAAGADPNLADSSGRRPLQLARARGYLEMVDLLLRAGAH